MKYFTFNIIFLLLLTTPQFSQNLEDKNVLVVWGGWDGHKPKKFANIIEDWLKTKNINYQIAEGVEVYDDLESLLKYDLIIQSVTMGELHWKQEENLTKAVKSGVGIAGAHGGLGDSFRNNTSYQFMIGGQWVSHPGNKVKFEVEILKDELTKGVNNFEVETEQYYMHGRAPVVLKCQKMEL
jgi:type 1 glutamine amidotransferase